MLNLEVNKVDKYDRENRPEMESVTWDNIPGELQRQARFVFWEWKWNGNKWSKPPTDGCGNDINAQSAANHKTFEDAKVFIEQNPGVGLGFALTGHMIGIDHDGCIDTDGRLGDFAKWSVATANTYTEVSPSGTGIKMFGLGAIQRGCNRDFEYGLSDCSVEVYCGKRYFTITGQVLTGTPSELGYITKHAQNLDSITGTIDEELSDRLCEGEDYEPASSEEVEAALLYLPEEQADQYDTWLKTGMALKSWSEQAGDEGTGFKLFDDFSARSPKYNVEQVQAKWDSFTRSKGLTVSIRSIFGEARKHGYKDVSKGGYRCRALSDADFLTQEFPEQEYLIEGLLTAGEPTVIGAPTKCMKTSAGLHMMNNLAHGKDYLGFKIAKPKKVLFLSGESHPRSLQRKLRDINKFEGITEPSGRLFINTDILPSLDQPRQLKDFCDEIKRYEADVVFIDPLYRSFAVGDAASNIYSMGEKLQNLWFMIQKTGCTAVLCHHFKKSSWKGGGKPDLGDLSQSGIAEFARGWILLKRKSEYRSDGIHELDVCYGGSSGHSGERILRIDEGTYEGGYSWDAKMITETEWVAGEGKRKTEEAELRQQAIQGEHDDNVNTALECIVSSPGIKTGELKSQLQAGGVSKKWCEKLTVHLEDVARIEDGPGNSKLFYEGEAE